MTNCKLKINHLGHSGYLNTVTVSPDGSLCASGGKDMKAMLWDLNDGKHLHTLDHNDIITALCFSPNRYWLCAAFGPSIKIWVSYKFQSHSSYFFVYKTYVFNNIFFCYRIWKARKWLRSLSQKLFTRIRHRKLILHSASPWRGLLMVRPSSLATPIMLSESGRFQSLLDKIFKLTMVSFIFVLSNKKHKNKWN